MPYVSLHPVRLLAWLPLGGRRICRDRRGQWYVLYLRTGRIRQLFPREGVIRYKRTSP